MGRRRGAGWARDALVLLAVLGLMALAGWGFAGLVERGRPRRQAFSRDMERALARAVEASVRAGGDIVDDPAVTDLIDGIASRLDAGMRALAGDSAVPPDLIILVADSDAVNAVAFPGNLIVVYAGLMRALDGPQELAGVLAHEAGHCVSNDSRNALIRELGLSVLIGASGAGAAGEMAGEVVRSAVRIRYGRRAEERADRFAVDLLASSGLDPAAFARALEALEESTGRLPDIVRYMDVHPPLERRIDDARARAADVADDPALKPVVLKTSWDSEWTAALAVLPTALDPP